MQSLMWSYLIMEKLYWGYTTLLKSLGPAIDSFDHSFFSLIEMLVLERFFSRLGYIQSTYSDIL